MTGPETLAAARYTQVQSVAQAVVAEVARIWQGIDPGDVLAAMAGEQGSAILAAVVAGQMTAAEGAAAYVAGAMAAQGAAAAAAGRLIPSSLAGVASDGRPLATLLYLPAVTTNAAVLAGMPPEAAALAGLQQLAMMTATQITDASRAATTVAMAAHPRVVAYTRVVRRPACARCLILSGRTYSYSTGFQRHPRCDCQMMPLSTEEWQGVQTPREIVDDMSEAERRRVFGQAGAAALDAGADVGQVVNARRGMTAAGTTLEGTTVRGLAGRRAQAAGADTTRRDGQVSLVNTVRLTPEAIMRQAGGDRAEQVRLLREHAYIT